MGDHLQLRTRAGVSVIPLEGGPLLIGRDPTNDVVLDDDEVSRRHAVIEPLSVGWSVRDLGSRNGTFVAGQRVVSTRALHHRDEIVLGNTRLLLVCESGAPTAMTTLAAVPAPELTRREQDVLKALFLPARSGEVFTEPASTKDIAAALFVSEAAVKQHLANLYAKFEVPEGTGRRAKLANEALRRGAVRIAEVLAPHDR